MRIAWLFGLVAIAGCGGRVVVDGSLGGGASSQGGAPGSSTGSGAGGGVGAGGSIGRQIATICQAYCDAHDAAGCQKTAGPCTEWCPEDAMYMGKCLDDYLALYSCYTKNGFGAAPACPDSPACDAIGAELLACGYPAGPCEPGSCSQPSDGLPIDCTRQCGGAIYETSCDGSTGAFSCTCKFNGATVGSCTETDLSGVCCIQFLAET